MNKIEEAARQALAAARSFQQEHSGHNGTLPADKQAEFGRMVDAAEQASAQLRTMNRMSALDDNLALWDDKAAEQNQLREAALPESLRGEPDLTQKVKLAVKNRDSSFQHDLQIGRTSRWMDLTEQGVPKEELALVIGTGNKGGFWTPDYWERVIVSEWRKIEGISEVVTPMVTADGNTIYIQARTQNYPGSTALAHNTDVSVYQVAEQGAYRRDAEPAYQRRSLEVFKYMQKNAASYEIFEDGLVDVPQEIGSFIGQWLGEIMEVAWTNGTGSGQPKGAFHGIQTRQEINAAAAGNPTIKDLHKMTTNNVRLASGNSDRSFLMPRQVWGEAVRDISTDNMPWWGIDMTSSGRMMMFGYPVHFGLFINPSVAATANPIGFGSWNRFLRTRIVNGIRMTVSDIAESDIDDITFRFRVRFGSQLADDNQVSFINCQ